MMIIRKMSYEDIPKIQEIAAITWAQTYEGIIPKEVQQEYLKFTYSEESLTYWTNDGFTFVCEIEDEVVGFSNFTSPDQKEQSSSLSAIYINPKFQGKGIGSQLLNAGIQRLKGIEKLYVSLEKGNTSAERFYTVHGFAYLKEFKEICHGQEFHTVQMQLVMGAHLEK